MTTRARCGRVESAHRSQSGFAPAVVAFDSVGSRTALPVDRDAIDLDPNAHPPTQQLIDIAIGAPFAQIPAHRQDDDVGRESESGEA